MLNVLLLFGVAAIGLYVIRPRSSREKVRAYSERLRQQSLRPIQIWVPDVRSPEFIAEAHRQSHAVARSARAHEDQDFIDAVSELGGA